VEGGVGVAFCLLCVCFSFPILCHPFIFAFLRCAILRGVPLVLVWLRGGGLLGGGQVEWWVFALADGVLLWVA